MKKKPFDLTNERKLTDQDVLVIRAVHIPRSPRYGSVILAQLFGVSQPTIDRVVKRLTYRHLHPLLLPGMLDPSYPFGEWAPDKTAYRAARRDLREAFAVGEYPLGDGATSSPGSMYAYDARPVRRVIKPEVEKIRRAKLRLAGLRQVFGEDFDEELGLAAAGLAPKLPQEEYRERVQGMEARKGGEAPGPRPSDEEIKRRLLAMCPKG